MAKQGLPNHMYLTPNSKIVRTNNSIGAKGIQNMQGTTRAIYDSLKLTLGLQTQPITLNFFQNVNTRQFPYTNITENKLQVGESMALQRLSLSILTVDNVNNVVTSINPLAQGGLQALYRSDLNFFIAQDQVIKKQPLQSMYAPFNKDSQFYGNQYAAFLGGVISVGVPQDVLHFDNPIVIPPQIEFSMPITLPPYNIAPTAGSDFYLMATIEGLGSLFAPKSTY